MCKTYQSERNQSRPKISKQLLDDLDSHSQKRYRTLMKFPVQYKINRLRAINFLILPLLFGICVFSIMGDGGLLHGYSANLRLKSMTNTVRKVELQNRMLKRQIQLAQSNPRIAKQLIAQNSLWAQPGSTIYRFEDIDNSKSDSESISHNVKEELTLLMETIQILIE